MIFTTLKKIAFALTALPIYLFGITCPPISGDVGIGYDYFRSIPDGDWDGNVGGLVSFNLGIPVSHSLGFQFGSSYGVYDWVGRGSSPSNRQSDVQQQVFITGGVFWETTCPSGFNAGIVYDWMWNRRFGVFAADPNFGQVRFQCGYQLCQTNEYGLWGTFDVDRSHDKSQGISLAFRGIAQINAYWKHLYQNCATTMLWFGFPYKKSLAFNSGRAGKFIFGGSFSAPLCGRFSIDGYASYMVPHSASRGFRQRYYGANICLELKYAIGDTYSGRKPYMPLGNNSNFISDTNVTF